MRRKGLERFVRWERAVLALFFFPLAIYLLETAGVPFEWSFVAVYSLWVASAAFLVYLRIRLGSDWAPWLRSRRRFQWPHLAVVYVCLIGIVLWYVSATSFVRVGVSLYRLVYIELFTAFFLEVYIVSEMRKAERKRLGD